MPRITPRAIPPAPPRTEGLSLAQVPGVLRRSWAWILLPTLIALVGAVAFVQLVPPRYTGEAKVLLESREPSFARPVQERADQAQPIDEQAVASQVQVMMSRDLAREAIRRLKLVGNPEFDPTAGPIGPVKQLLMTLGLVQNPLDRPAEDRVLEAYFERLLVYPAGKSRILSVEFRARDAALAAQGANTVSELYLASLEAAKVDTARYASTWLGGNIESLRKRVSEAEARIEAYRAKNGLVGATGATGQPLNAQQLGELSTQLSQARTLRADLAGRVKAVKDLIKDGRSFEIPDVANNELIRRTVENRIAVRAQLALESRTLLPAHPRIKELTAQLADLDQQIKAAAERITRTLENDARIAGARVDSLQAAVDGQRDVVVKGNSSEIQLRALEREAKSQREQLESYLSRYREAAARDAESATPADARIISRAVVPDMPSFPKKVPVVALCTALALLFSIGAVVGRALLSDPDGGSRAPRPARAEETDEAPARRIEPFAFPEAAPPARWAAMPFASFGPGSTAGAAFAPPALDPVRAEPAARLPADGAPVEDRPVETLSAGNRTSGDAAPAPEPADDAFVLGPLVDRLARVRGGEGGRAVLLVETQADTGLFDALAEALGARATALALDLNGDAAETGLSDVVAGRGAFLDAIQGVPGSGLHRVGPGRAGTAVLLDGSEALAVALAAMAEAYDWVICRLRPGADALDLLAVVGGHMDSVVIASDAPADDPDLGDLFALAAQTGAGQVLVAQDRPAVADALVEATPLRLSAA